MTSVLRELYLGNLDPSGRAVPNTTEYREKRTKFFDTCDHFEAQLKELSPEAPRQLEHLLDRFSDLTVLEAEDAFYYGFRLGAALMAETFCGDIPAR